MRIIALVNEKAGAQPAGGFDDPEHLEQMFAARGVDAAVRKVSGGQLNQAARRAIEADVDAVIVGGGDGSISAAAGALAGTGMPLGILPMGTLNHFAKDLGIPQDVDEAVRVIAAGMTRDVDVAEVNGRTFINNSSIGLYPQIVREREDQRMRLGRGKWMAMFIAALGSVRRFPLVRVRIGMGERSVLRTTPFVFVGNNPYEMNLFAVRGRQRLDGGELCLYVANHSGRFGMLIMALRAVVGRLEQSKDFESATFNEVWIESGKRRLHVAIDGEVDVLAPPLHYRIRPRSLRVFAPPAPAEPSVEPTGADVQSNR